MTRTALKSIEPESVVLASVIAAESDGGDRVTADDALLVRRCLEGADDAWRQMYDRCQLPLQRAIGSLLGEDRSDLATIDEIAARVWYALVRDEFRLLASYDLEREVRLSSYLAGLARIEVLRFFRSERRRRTHESRGGRRLLRMRRAPVHFDSVMREFAATLTEAEKELLESHLTPPGDDQFQSDHASLSRSAIYQRRHRIRGKLREFFETE